MLLVVTAAFLAQVRACLEAELRADCVARGAPVVHWVVHLVVLAERARSHVHLGRVLGRRGVVGLARLVLGSDVLHRVPVQYSASFVDLEVLVSCTTIRQDLELALADHRHLLLWLLNLRAFLARASLIQLLLALG